VGHVKYSRKIFTLLFIISIILFVQGCDRNNKDNISRLKTITIQSKILGKDMESKVYLPKGYISDNKYPVLYFFHDYGGTADTVIYDYGIIEKTDLLVETRQIKPLIIVALRIERSFGINSSTENKSIQTQSGKSFYQGMYEDYIIKEAIPYIDSEFNTISSKNGRYIGGYSMGGFAALYVAFHHNEMFSRVGGHSPSLFVNEFPDKYVSDWLYPNEQLRKERDPIYLAQDIGLTGLTVYIDTGETDVNVEGCKKLYDTLQEKGVKSEYHLFTGNHSRAYCNNFMDKYLRFYGSE
jgi:enterochelin esterase-like enzyme